MLTPAQLATLKAAILADNTLASKPFTSGGATEIATVLNAAASPAFTVWKSMVSINLIGKSFDNTELAGLTTANQTRLQTLAMFLSGGVDPSKASNRGFFDDIFSGAGGANTRAALLALWKRLATRAEKLYATGTGSDVVPATLVFEGSVSSDDVQQARELP